jgi:hypothetical protein
MARRHPRKRHRIDGRTRVARRAQALARAYAAAMDNPADALALEAINRAATLSAQAEDARGSLQRRRSRSGRADQPREPGAEGAP